MNKTMSEYYKNTFNHLLYCVALQKRSHLAQGKPCNANKHFSHNVFSFLFFALADNLNTNNRLHVLNGMLLENNKN